MNSVLSAFCEKFEFQRIQRPGEYDQEISQSQTVDRTMALRGRYTEQQQPDNSKDMIKVKQSALSSSAR